jgi:hypothetical protein
MTFTLVIVGAKRWILLATKWLLGEVEDAAQKQKTLSFRFTTLRHQKPWSKPKKTSLAVLSTLLKNI